MSIIPVQYSAIRSAPMATRVAVRRLPRAAGLFSAAVVSAGLWYAAIEALRLIF